MPANSYQISIDQLQHVEGPWNHSLVSGWIVRHGDCCEHRFTTAQADTRVVCQTKSCGSLGY